MVGTPHRLPWPVMECAGPATVVFDPTLTEYDFGPSHPMSPVRVDLTMRLAADLGVTGGRAGLRLVDAPFATLDQIATVHDAQLIEAVERCGRTSRPEELLGLGTDDNPVFPGMHEAAAHVVGASLEAFRQVWSGESAARRQRDRRPAPRDAGPGQRLLRLQRRRGRHPVAARPGRRAGGVRRRRRAPRRRRRADLLGRPAGAHRSPCTRPARCCSPGTGFPEDLGGAGAEGTAVNVALPPGTADAGWLRAFHAVVPDLVREFAPDVLVTQHGCDSHAADPLAHLMLSVDGQRAAYLALHDLAHEAAGGRWVATGGGGYALVEVVPRAWTHLLAIVGGAPLDPATATPESWRAYVRERTGRDAAHGAHRRPVPGLPALGRRLRPGHLARPGRQRHPQGGLPAARARPDAVTEASGA